MSKFWDVKTLQKFASVHTSIHNHFNYDRHLNYRETFKQDRSAALA
jgi:putative transposase